MLDIKHLKQLISDNNAIAIAEYIKQYDISIVDNKLVFPKQLKHEAETYWDKRQLIRKINLNSLNIGRV